MYGLDTRYDDGHRLNPSTRSPASWAPNLALATTGGCRQRRGAACTRAAACCSTSPRTARYARARAGLEGPGGHQHRTRARAPPAAALLIRPDGYVAWAGATDTGDDGTLRGALATWFGAPKAGEALAGTG